MGLSDACDHHIIANSSYRWWAAENAMPFFSTIIPTYNRRELLRRALKSVLAQDPVEPQVIVVDDGSTDGTMDMLAELADRVQTLRQPNRGPGAARNLGLTHATGDYVAFLDSDDVWFPWTLATYRRVIDEHNRPAFIVGRPLRFVDEAKLPDVKADALLTEAFPDYYASGDQWRWYGVSSFVIRRDALTAAGGFADTIINGEDADLTMKLGVAPGFVQVRFPVTFAYFDHPGNITFDAEKCYHGVCWLIDQERNGRYPGGAPRRAERWRILGRHARAVSLSLLNAGMRRQAWETYRKTCLWNLTQARFRYVLGFPVKALLQRPTTGKGAA
ncbi:MAG: glycosyltransferase [Tepidisphaeraceae bacterium]|jgi:hypothetical protein